MLSGLLGVWSSGTKLRNFQPLLGLSVRDDACFIGRFIQATWGSWNFSGSAKKVQKESKPTRNGGQSAGIPSSRGQPESWPLPGVLIRLEGVGVRLKCVSCSRFSASGSSCSEFRIGEACRCGCHSRQQALCHVEPGRQQQYEIIPDAMLLSLFPP